MAQADHVTRVSCERHAVEIETRDPDRCYMEIATEVLEHNLAGLRTGRAR